MRHRVYALVRSQFKDLLGLAGIKPKRLQGGTDIGAEYDRTVVSPAHAQRAGAGREVIETRIVKMGPEVISQISSKSFTRNDGTWVSRQEFRIPEGWSPGEYTLEQVVQSEDTWISGTVKFYVN